MRINLNDLLLKLFEEVEHVWPRLGYPPLVTPYSQYVKNVALMNSINLIKGKERCTLEINTEDAEASSLERDTYMTGVEREMNEELVIRSGYQQRIVALINDDSNEVGQVHLGVVHLFELDSPDVAA